MKDSRYEILSLSSNAIMISYDEKWDMNRYVERFSESLLDRVNDIDATKWAVIDDISNWPVKPPEKVKMCKHVAKELVEKGLCHFAVCGSEFAVSKWMMEQIVPKQVELAFFDDVTGAKQWLSECGYDVAFASARA